ncbi:MAG: hypothetical protein A4S17_01390 [Proteobacteria bacterium HN_bin10]|nr:MAG: hypothetical protein A4S17_01390 [Proteobacteria bacterium HN_bin10]
MDAREKTWHGLRAASLSLVPGIGHLYLGEKRGYLIVAFAVVLLIVSRTVWAPAELLYASLVIFSGVDAYSIAKRGHGLM